MSAPDHPEILSIFDSSNDLETALSNVSEDLICAFKSDGLISNELCCNLLDQNSRISKRKGKWLMKSIEDKIMESHRHFAIFVYRLRQAGHLYQNVLSKLDKVYFEQVKEYLENMPLPLESSLPNDQSSLGFVRARTPEEAISKS